MRTTQVPATRSPTRRRSRLNKGKKRKRPLHSRAKRVRKVSATPSAAWAPRKERGRNTSISRIALRARTAPPVNRAPSRATTLRPISRLPGVAPRPPISNRVNQKFLRQKKPTSQRIPNISDLAAAKARAITIVPRMRTTIIATKSSAKAAARAPAPPSSSFKSTPSGVTKLRRMVRGTVSFSRRRNGHIRRGLAHAAGRNRGTSRRASTGRSHSGRCRR